MKMNHFLKKVASESLEKDFSREDFYYVLKYIGVKKDTSLANDIEKFYQEFLDSLNNSLVRYDARSVKEGVNASHYIAFYADERADAKEAVKVYFPVKYEYMISALKTVFLYLIRNNIESTVKFHVKNTNEGIVIRFYHQADVLPFIHYCNSNFALEDLLLEVNPFIATIHGLGIVKDDNHVSSYNDTLCILLEEYYKFLKLGDALNRASDLDFLDFIVKREESETSPEILYNMESIEKNIRSILMNKNPLEES